MPFLGFSNNQRGPQGDPGPSAVSTDANNLSVLGTDSLVYTPTNHDHSASQITDANDVGQNLITLANPSEESYLRINANNTISTLSGDELLAALGELKTVNNITELKALEVPAGTYVRVLGYHSPEYGGGGVFKMITVNDFVSNTNYAAGAASGGIYHGSNIVVNWPFNIERDQALYANIPDRIQWANGAIWTKNSSGLSPGDREGWTSFRVWVGDAAIGVANAEKGYIIPKVEGFRVIPTYAGYDRSVVWERVITDGIVTPEMYGAKRSDRFGVLGSGNDCSPALQACLDSHCSVRINGGNWYLGSPVFLKYRKSVVGVGADNTNADQVRDPGQIADHHMTRLWTDQNINLLNVQRPSHIEKIQFNVEKTANGVYDKTCLNYDCSFPNWGSSVWFCSFHGNVTTVTTSGNGGTAIRFNFDDADNTLAQLGNATHTNGYICAWSSRKLHINSFKIGHKIDPLKSGNSPVSGNPIGTWGNCIELDACFNGVKQFIRWEACAVNRITGEYMQDTFCLPYAERDTPAIYIRNGGGTSIDLGIGDQRFTKPAVNDDVLLGGSITYPQNHYVGYNYDVEEGSVQFIGRSLRDYNWGYSKQLGTVPYTINNTAFLSLDNVTGHNFWAKNINKYTDYTSWVDNGFCHADLKSTVTINALRNTGGSLTLANEVDTLHGTLPAAANVVVANTSELWNPLGGIFIPSITFNGGSDADNDFVEIAFSNQTAAQEFINRCHVFLGVFLVGFKFFQIIQKTAGSTLLNLTIPTAIASNTVKRIGIPLVVNNSTNKIILRFIGSTGVVTQIQSLHMNTIGKHSTPFLTLNGGTLLGNLSVNGNLDVTISGIERARVTSSLLTTSVNILNSQASGGGYIGVTDTRSANRQVLLGLSSAGTRAEFALGAGLSAGFVVINQGGWSSLFCENGSGQNNEVRIATNGTNVSGFPSMLLVGGNFAPTSGTTTFTDHQLNPTINQTGGANGITRGLYVNPVLTAAADWRSVETNNNTGWAFYGAGTAASFFGGNISISGASRNIFNISNNSLALGTNNTARVTISADGATWIFDQPAAVRQGLNIAHGVSGVVHPTDTNLVLPKIWYTAPIVRFEFYADGGTANVTIKKNDVAIGSAWALSSGHTTVTDMTGITTTNTSGDYYSIHWNSGTATKAIVNVIMEE